MPNLRIESRMQGKGFIALATFAAMLLLSHRLRAQPAAPVSSFLQPGEFVAEQLAEPTLEAFHTIGSWRHWKGLKAFALVFAAMLLLSQRAQAQSASPSPPPKAATQPVAPGSADELPPPPPAPLASSAKPAQPPAVPSAQPAQPPAVSAQPAAPVPSASAYPYPVYPYPYGWQPQPPPPPLHYTAAEMPPEDDGPMAPGGDVVVIGDGEPKGKGRNTGKAGRILLGVGFGVALLGGLFTAVAVGGGRPSGDYGALGSQVALGMGVAFLGAGGASILVAIPLMAVSSE